MHKHAPRPSRQQRMLKKTKEEINQAYTICDQLGEGGFGKVYQAIENKTGREVAIKILDKRQVHQRNMSSRVISEINIHQRLRHPFILQLYSYFEDEDSVYLVLELCHKGSLHDYVRMHGRLKEDQVRYFLRQIVMGLKYLHQNRIIHRDLTLANLLVTKDNKVKISDFGLATEISDGRTNKTMCGTPNYISPEVSNRGAQGVEVDVWSLGVMLYTLLVGKAPFDTKDPKTTMDNAKRLRYDIPGHLDADAIDLIAKLLREKPQDRMKLPNILEHPFLKKADGPDAVYQSHDSGTDSTQSWVSSQHQNQHQHHQSPSPVLTRRHASTGQLLPAQQQQLQHRRQHPESVGAMSSSPEFASQRRGRSSSQSCQQQQQQQQHYHQNHILYHHQQQQPQPLTPRHHSQGYVTQSDRSPLACAHSAAAAAVQQHQQQPVLATRSACSTAAAAAAGATVSMTTPKQHQQQSLVVGNEQQQQPAPPLDTSRLEGCRITKGSLLFTLSQADGSITVEQLKQRGDSTRVIRAIRISSDGRAIEYAANLNLPLLPDSPVAMRQCDCESYVYPNLADSNCAKLYSQAAAFVRLLRSNTARLTLYTSQAKCVLYENLPEPDFCVNFYDGRRARRTAACPLTIDGRSVMLQSLSRAEAEVLHFVNETYDQVRRIESVLTGVSGQGDICCFPATIGKPPQIQQQCPPSEAPVASASAAATGSKLATTERVNGETATPPPADLLSGAVESLLMDAPQSSCAPLLLTRFQPIGQDCADILVEFNDSSQLELRGGGCVDGGASLERVVYVNRFGKRRLFDSRQLAQQLPPAVATRMALFQQHLQASQ